MVVPGSGRPDQAGLSIEGCGEDPHQVMRHVPAVGADSLLDFRYKEVAALQQTTAQRDHIRCEQRDQVRQT